MPKSRKRALKPSKTKKSATTKAMQRMLNNGVLEGRDVKVVQSTGVKMSELLLNVIVPLTDAAEDLEQFRKAVMVGMVAWNGAIQETGTPEVIAQKMASMLKLADDPDFISIVAALVARKQLLYPDNKRLIINYDAQETRSGFHLNVMSTPESAP